MLKVRTTSFRLMGLLASHSSWTTCKFPPTAKNKIKNHLNPAMKDNFYPNKMTA